jgi:DNA polymerase elongation subunit (family B)
LVIDIETLPAEVYAFTLRDSYISPDHVKVPDRMACYAASFVGEDKIHFYSEFHHGVQIMRQKLFEHMDEADVVVTYNGDNFDLPWIQRTLHPMVPSPSVSVDLYKVGRKNHKYLSHKLSYLLASLDLHQKLGHEGFQLWVDCLNGDPRAWAKMRRYNKQDAAVTKELLTELLPYVKNMPHPALFDDSLPLLGCPNCEDGGNPQRRGYATTKTRRYPRFRCQACGKWFRGVGSDLGVQAT